ncbi:hypothetical protein B0J18DRAFT_446476 [Chaetomium sp. MPI-SDFR-AT-0129]|nr:hypothetical protein B0J18DRAFT_446476 [Chaetomium sp. MPI-SDFR-AT-0129]
MTVDRVTAQIQRLALAKSTAFTNSALSVVQVAETNPTGQGGRLASRLVRDWFAGHPGQQRQEKPNSDPRLTEQNQGPSVECPPLRIFPPRSDGSPDHDLIVQPGQSYGAAHDPEGRGRTLISCMCRCCRYHFVFKINPSPHKDGAGHLQHHFRVVEASWNGLSEAAAFHHSKPSPHLCRFQYACTLCAVSVDLEISLPRLKPTWLKMIMDEKRIKESLKVAKKQDPTRYADVTAEKETHYVTTVLYTLSQYLKNVLDDDGKGSRKKISCRNKTFMVQFGRDCDQVFRYLGFEEEEDRAANESYWLPPQLPPQEGKTPIGSPRAFYDDVRSEVQSILDYKPPVQGEPVVRPVSASARDELEKALECDRSHRSFSTLSVNKNEEEHFAALGAPVDADDALIKFAFNRQVELDPENTPIYLEALGTLAARRSEELQMFVFTHQELLAKQKETATSTVESTPVEKAYAHFGLSKACPEDAKYFIGVYRTYREQSPAQKSDHRLALLRIGKDRHSEEILKEVFETQMDLPEACQFLRVEGEWPMDSIAVSAQSVASELDPDQLDLQLLALDTIALKRPMNDPNRPAFDGIVAELRSRLTQFISNNPAEEARGPQHAVNVDLPVGLANLRNTCYLNSILQYFYSVKAVRNLAVTSELDPLEPTEANLSSILLIGSNGGSDGPDQSPSELETGRAFVGHEFTRELSTLFRDLDATGEVSIPPRQRLANAALLRPEKLRPHSADVPAVAASGDGDAPPPPLPPRAGESPPTNVADAPMGEPEQVEVESTRSSQTLVEHPREDNGPLVSTLDDRSSDKATAATAPSPAHDMQTSDTATSRPNEGDVKISKLTVEELAVELDKPNVGSDQMDVDEVMGNAIDHLRAAFKISSIGAPKSTTDPIEQAFFSTFIDSRKKRGEKEWNRTSRSDRWVTAYPSQTGTRGLYDALAISFDLELLPDNLLSFTSIEKPAPHFHICIQRSDGVRKNGNPITIPETLYLDRFMHTADIHSPLFKARKRGWDIKTRLNEMEPATGEEKSKLFADDPNWTPAMRKRLEEVPDEEVDAFLVSDEYKTPFPVELYTIDPALKQLMDKYGVAAPKPIQPPPPTKPVDMFATDDFWKKFEIRQKEQKEQLTAERDGLFRDAHDVAYRLHAVVCHAGTSASAGHYWVWIHDFEDDVWRKYNDTVVSVHPAEFVFNELNTKGEPYYLAYVKADEVQNLVSVPRRQPMVAPPVPPRPNSAHNDVVMTDDADSVLPSIEQWEDVEVAEAANVDTPRTANNNDNFVHSPDHNRT